MKVRDLHKLVVDLVAKDPSILEREVRIGDQIESGPYLHASVGGVWRGRNNEVVFCANDDEQWQDDAAGYHPDFELEKLWIP